MPRPGGPPARWVAFHWAQLDKHATAHSAVVLVCMVQTVPAASLYLPLLCNNAPTPDPSLLESKKNRGVKTWPLVRARCLRRYKSRRYGGLCWGLPDLRTPGFSFHFDSDEGPRQRGRPNIWWQRPKTGETRTLHIMIQDLLNRTTTWSDNQIKWSWHRLFNCSSSI